MDRVAGRDILRTIQVETAPNGARIVRIDESDTHSRMIPIDVIASHAELLGYDDPVEALEALIHIQDHGDGSVEGDDEAGPNWATDAYALLQHREQRREEAAVDVIEGVVNRAEVPQSKTLYSTLAAHHAVHEPIDGGECVMDRCRRAARERLGVREPSRKAGASSRVKTRASVMRASLDGPDESEDRSTLRQALSGDLEGVQACRNSFLHELGGHPFDPIDDTPVVEEVDSVEEVMRRYGKVDGEVTTQEAPRGVQ